MTGQGQIVLHCKVQKFRSDIREFCGFWVYFILRAVRQWIALPREITRTGFEQPYLVKDIPAHSGEKRKKVYSQDIKRSQPKPLYETVIITTEITLSF